MKILSYLILFLTLIIGGCEDNSDLSTKPDRTDQIKLIELPAKENLSIESDFSVSQIINGATGGEILFESSYPGGPFGTVTIYANIVFPPNAFVGERNITMTVSDDLAVLTFSPPMVFNTPAILNVTFGGLDLADVDPANVNFIYINDDGSTIQVYSSNLSVTKQIGKINLDDAIIPHFSRLGFTR